MKAFTPVYVPVGVPTFHLESAQKQFDLSVQLLRSIDERFAASLAKCATPEAREAHARRYETAKAIRNEINRLCEEELIP